MKNYSRPNFSSWANWNPNLALFAEAKRLVADEEEHVVPALFHYKMRMGRLKIITSASLSEHLTWWAREREERERTSPLLKKRSNRDRHNNVESAFATTWKIQRTCSLLNTHARSASSRRGSEQMYCRSAARSRAGADPNEKHSGKTKKVLPCFTFMHKCFGLLPRCDSWVQTTVLVALLFWWGESWGWEKKQGCWWKQRRTGYEHVG